jgi:hypothetical protein
MQPIQAGARRTIQWSLTVIAGALAAIYALSSGVATGLGYVHGTRVINALAPQDKRAEIVSTYQIFCFGGLALPVIGAALLSRTLSALAAEAVFALVMAMLVIGALLVTRAHPPKQQSRP